MIDGVTHPPCAPPAERRSLWAKEHDESMWRPSGSCTRLASARFWHDVEVTRCEYVIQAARSILSGACQV